MIQVVETGIELHDHLR